MVTAERKTEIECMRKCVVGHVSYAGVGIVRGTLGGIDPELNKQIGNLQVRCIQIIQDLRGIASRRSLQLTRRKVRAAREQAYVYMIEAQQIHQAQCCGTL